MTDAPATEAPWIGVVADDQDAVPEALRIVAHLRASGHSCDYPLRGNVKRRVDAIRKSGAKGVLFVKTAEQAKDRVHLSVSRDLTEDPLLLHLAVLGALPEPYNHLSSRDLGADE